MDFAVTRGRGIASSLIPVGIAIDRNGQPIVVDQEVQSGIEDLQIEFMMYDNRFIAASELVAGDFVRAVRIWLLARSLYWEAAVNEAVPQYADRSALESDHSVIAVSRGESLIGIKAIWQGMMTP